MLQHEIICLKSPVLEGLGVLGIKDKIVAITSPRSLPNWKRTQ